MVTTGRTHPHSRFEAEVECLERVLRGYGVLTHDRLRDLSGACHWSEPVYEAVLREAVRRRVIRRLGDELYELDETSLSARADRPR